MRKFLVGLITLVLFLISIQTVNAGRGCCSWHGGQDYCDTSVGRWVCNDGGTYSPSCTCYKATQNPKPTTKPNTESIYTRLTQTPPPTSGGSDTFYTIIGLGFLGGLGALGLLVMGAIVNWFRRPDDFDRKFVKTLMDAQEEVYEKDKTYLLTSTEYLNWESRNEEVDNLVCGKMEMTPYRYERLVRKPQIKLLYKRLAIQRERDKETRSKWAIVRWGEYIWRWGEDRAGENIFYGILLYPIGFALSITFSISMLGLLFVALPTLLFQILVWLGWWSFVVIGLIIGLIYLWQKRKH